MTIDKGLTLSGGMGGSAASSVAGALAAARAIEQAPAPTALMLAALAGESVVSGRHLDNIAASVRRRADPRAQLRCHRRGEGPAPRRVVGGTGHARGADRDARRARAAAGSVGSRGMGAADGEHGRAGARLCQRRPRAGPAVPRRTATRSRGVRRSSRTSPRSSRRRSTVARWGAASAGRAPRSSRWPLPRPTRSAARARCRPPLPALPSSVHVGRVADEGAREQP